MSSASPAVGTRAQPFYCPYCGEQEFRPVGTGAEQHCECCDRRFTVRFLGLGPGAEEFATERAMGASRPGTPPGAG